ncbi:hypothetical protein PFISCL1PPCAC_15155, partial [Pristionchus fissidentatus]
RSERMWLILAVLLPLSLGLEMSLTECKEAGFNVESLKCSSCEHLNKFGLEALMTDCQSCCTAEKELKHEKFPMANVEVCECNLARFPQIQAFVRKNMESAWNGKVRVKHVRGVRPQVVLKDSSGNARQALNVEKWDTDTLIDFLNQWIE